MKARLVVIVLILMLALLFSGCQFSGFDTQNMMRPPKATGDEADIQRVIEKAGGADITLKYPQNGEYRSAVVMFDITGDGEEEAVAFYSSNKGKDTSLHMMVIAKLDGKWTSLGDFFGNGSVVDRIMFGDLNGDGVQEIVVGWTNSYNTNVIQLSVYQMNGEEQSVSPLEVDYTYSNLMLEDFDGDDADEILLTSLNDTTNDIVADAKLLKLDQKSGLISNIGRVELDPTVTRYESVVAGNLSPNIFGVVIDGQKAENILITEAIYWDQKNKELKAPLTTLKNEKNPTERTVSTVSGDIDGNGIIEIPLMKSMPGDTANMEEAERCYITQWSWYDVIEREWNLVYNMVANLSDGYGFQLPQSWEDHVTARMETETRTLTFYEWVLDSQEVGGLGVAILKIQVFSEAEWKDSSRSKDFIMLRTQNERIYAVQLPQVSSDYAISYEEVQKNFKLVSNS